MKTIYISLILSFLLTSCYDKSLIEPSKGYANLTVKVFDKDNNPAVNARVTILNKYGLPVVDDYTNSNGELTRPLASDHYIIISRILVKNVWYETTNEVQLANDIDRTIETRPFNNTGWLKFKIVDLKSVPIPNINVALLSTSLDNSNYSFAEAYKRIFVEGQTDSNGFIAFVNIPNNYVFYIFIYRNEKAYYSQMVFGYRVRSLDYDYTNEFMFQY